MKILFNISFRPVDDIFIETTCLNIMKMVKDPIIVINLTTQDQVNNLSDFVKDKPIYVNAIPRRGNMFDVLVQNYKYIKNNGINVDYIIFYLSETYMIKSGIEDYISDFDAGVQYIHKIDINNNSELSKIAFNDVKGEIRDWFLAKNFTHVCKVTAEGSFFKAEIFDKMIDILESECPNYWTWGAYYKKWGPTMTRFWVEEILAGTIIHNGLLGDIKIGDQITWMDHSAHMNNCELDHSLFLEIVDGSFKEQKINNILRTSKNTFSCRRIPNNLANINFKYIQNNLI